MMVLFITLVLILLDAIVWAVICTRIHDETPLYGFFLGPFGVVISCGYCLRDILKELKKRETSTKSETEPVNVMAKRIKLKPIKF